MTWQMAALLLLGGSTALLLIGMPVALSCVAINIVGALRADGAVELDDGRVVPAHAVWPVELEGALLDRLAAGELDDERDFLVRLKILHLLETREADGLGSFLGGRIRLFPHQLYVAERACAAEPVRWLLADEVGLGKTIEAALILNRLTHTKRVERCLVVTPESLSMPAVYPPASLDTARRPLLDWTRT